MLPCVHLLRAVLARRQRASTPTTNSSRYHRDQNLTWVLKTVRAALAKLEIAKFKKELSNLSTKLDTVEAAAKSAQSASSTAVNTANKVKKAAAKK